MSETLPNQLEQELNPNKQTMERLAEELDEIAKLRQSITSELEGIVEYALTRLSVEALFDHQIDAKEVSLLLKCSVSTVERLTRTGAIPSFKVGRLRRYNKKDVLQSVNDNSGHGL